MGLLQGCCETGVEAAAAPAPGYYRGRSTEAAEQLFGVQTISLDAWQRNAGGAARECTTARLDCRPGYKWEAVGGVQGACMTMARLG